MKRTLSITAILLVLLSPMFSTGCRRDPATRAAAHMARGKRLAAEKDFARAALEYSNATQLQPKNAEAWYQLALACLGSGQTAQAVVALRRATDADPKHTAAQLALAQLMVRTNDQNVLTAAAQRLEQLLTADANNPDALDALALAEMKMHKPEDAYQHLEQALAKFPGRLRTSAEMAAIQYQKGDFEAAEATLKKAIEADPKSPDAALAMAHLYFLERKLLPGEEQLKRALELDPGNASALLSLGGLQVSQSRFVEAEAIYARLAALPGNYKYAHAGFLLMRGRNDEAVAEFEKLSKTAKDPASRLRLASAYASVKRGPDAIRVLSEVLKANPRNSDALLFRSRLYLAAGKPAEADNDIQEVLRFAPDSADAHYGLAKLRRLRGDEQGYIHELREVVRLRPGLLAPRGELARALVQGNKPKQALDTMDSAPPFQKSAIEWIIPRNWALLAMGQDDEAEKYVQAGLKLKTAPELMLQNGVVLLHRKKFALARSEAMAVLKLAPTSSGALNLAVQCAIAENKPAEAEDLLRRAAARSSNDPGTLLAIGRWFEILNKADDARKSYQSAKAVETSSRKADLALASLDMRQGKTDSARATLQAVAAAEQNNLEARLMLGGIEYTAHNYDAALAAYEGALKLDPDNVNALNSVAYLQANSGSEVALKYATRAMELAPDNAAVADTLGWVYYQRGAYSQAIQYLRIAMEKDPSPLRQFHLGMSYLKSGNQKEGAIQVNQALAKQPDLAKTQTGW